MDTKDSKRIFIFIAVAVLVVVIIYGFKDERFWGGYFPTPYMNQPVQSFARTGFDAATDAPHLIVNYDSCPINPYCAKCKRYRCCCN